jgi:fumarylacetoacetase
MASSWVPDMDPASDFSLANIPFGIISTPDDPEPHAAVAIGSCALDLKVLSAGIDLAQVFPGIDALALTDAFYQPTLNAFAAMGRAVHRQVRAGIQDLLSTTTTHPSLLRDNASLRAKALIPQSKARMHLPMAIGDYTDFYAGYHHAYAVGVMFRGPDNALQPNYLHLPVGYHGRASSVVVSGTPVHRPVGQILLDPTAQPKQPVTAPSRKLDIELELGCFIARGNEMGTAVPVGEADEHIFGYVLLNDWSARDVQTWEYVPLGPFNGKNFATTISPWVVLADALEPFRARGVENATELQGYLREGREESVFNIRLEVDLTSEFAMPSNVTLRTRCRRLMQFASGRGRHDHHWPHQLQAPDLVVPADDCPPHAGRLSAAHRRPARLGYHQRPGRRRRAGESAGDDRERQEGGAAGGHGRADFSEGW